MEHQCNGARIDMWFCVYDVIRPRSKVANFHSYEHSIRLAWWCSTNTNRVEKYCMSEISCREIIKAENISWRAEGLSQNERATLSTCSLLFSVNLARFNCYGNPNSRELAESRFMKMEIGRVQRNESSFMEFVTQSIYISEFKKKLCDVAQPMIRKSTLELALPQIVALQRRIRNFIDILEWLYILQWKDTILINSVKICQNIVFVLRSTTYELYHITSMLVYHPFFHRNTTFNFPVKRQCVENINAHRKIILSCISLIQLRPCTVICLTI